MRLQFGLRTLLILALLFGLASYWFGPALLELIEGPEIDQRPFRTHGGVI